MCILYLISVVVVEMLCGMCVQKWGDRGWSVVGGGSEKWGVLSSLIEQAFETFPVKVSVKPVNRENSGVSRHTMGNDASIISLWKIKQ